MRSSAIANLLMVTHAVVFACGCSPSVSGTREPLVVVIVDEKNASPDDAASKLESSRPTATDEERNRLSLQQALVGHWHMQVFDKHEYYEFIAPGPSSDSSKPSEPRVILTWQVGAGPEKSDGGIEMFFHSVNEEENSFILKHYSAHKEYTYLNRYTFDADRKHLTIQSLGEDLRARFNPNRLEYVDSTKRSPLVK